MHRFTAEFGMGSGGSNALLPPGKLFETLQSRSGASLRLRPTLGSPVKNRSGLRLHVMSSKDDFSFGKVSFVCGAWTRSQSRQCTSVHDPPGGVFRCRTRGTEEAKKSFGVI